MRKLLGLIAFLLVAVTVSAAAGEVRNLRVWAGPESTRAVLDLGQRVDYRLFTLDDPSRVVIDIDGVDLERSLDLDEEHSGVIRRVRHGVREGNDLRVVLDLEEQARPQSFLLAPAGEYGHRLVVDLYPEDAQSPGERVREAVQSAMDGERDMIVAVDAGHGGEDPGAIGPSGTHEKNVALALARELKQRIDDEPGMRGVLIRTGDYYIPLEERYARAREARADLFLSIHADAFRDRRVRGSSVYVLSRSGASSEAARLLARSENRSDLVGGVKLDRGDDVLSSVLLDLSQNVAMEYSAEAAEAILGQLARVGKQHRDRVERANFVVLRSPDVPSVLVEVGFISNPHDEANLNSGSHRRRVSEAIVNGVRKHFFETAPQGTWIAANRDGSRHVVERGESLGVIAQKYRTSVSRIRQANNIDGDVIHPGAVLVIPAGS
ncbi:MULTISPECIES: N-acetylmuramoyl-L-alanine amidase [unclassified Wenzhouxiangella]|uniref:N-acetylmuramoyl-L-alanine amidase n=1 Tax=unclassified Wenzhouxiangella TaxID=2613841 RepID=UPI000E3262F6|nr:MULTISPECIES: N-acetylmuramoyl-L-alanine amidase [unclassified Wenzhouxiangella]RFF26384.1 AMIN domain-containing protein [Wenzhouxiangella sp. 15181]RFP67344.1 AMIN domain-containing protein [Wenzhouxiangella sp. 15190]